MTFLSCLKKIMSNENRCEPSHGKNRVSGGKPARVAVLSTLVHVAFILSMLLWPYLYMWLPSGDHDRDRAARPVVDFTMFYGSALLLRDSPSQLYDDTLQGEWQKAATGVDISGKDVDFLPYPYPPVVALAFVP